MTEFIIELQLSPLHFLLLNPPMHPSMLSFKFMVHFFDNCYYMHIWKSLFYSFQLHVCFVLLLCCVC